MTPRTPSAQRPRPRAPLPVLFAILLALACGAPPGAAAQKRTLLDQAKIIVNDRVLTTREVATLRDLQIKELSSRLQGAELQRAVKLLETNLNSQLVDNLLLEARAEEVGVTVSDKEIDQRVDSILRREPTVTETYPEAQIKDFIYKDALRRQVLQREVNSRVRVDDEEIKRVCLQAGRESREVDVGHILVRGDTPQDREKIVKIRQQLLAGADFEQEAVANSQDPSVSINHGRLGFISRGQFVKEFEDAAFSLPVGQLSEPVHTQFGTHLIRVFAERTRATANCEALDEASRTRFFNTVYNQLVEKRMSDFLGRMRKRADIQIFDR